MTTKVVVKQSAGSRFHVLPSIVLSGEIEKRKESPPSIEKKIPSEEVKKVQYKTKASCALGSKRRAGSSNESWRVKTRMQCHQCRENNHIAQKCHTQKKLLSWMDKGKETEKKVILWRQDLANEKKSVVEVTCPHSSSPCQAHEYFHQFVKLPQKNKDQSLQKAKSVEINNKFNPVNPAEAPKGIELNEEEKVIITPGDLFRNDSNDKTRSEYSYHNIYGESIINSVGSRIPFKGKASNLVDHTEALKVVKVEKRTSIVAKVTKCNSNIDESSDKEQEEELPIKEISFIHYKRDKKGCPQMCMKYKDGSEDIVPMPNYAHKCEGDEEEPQKAWREVENLSKESMQYSDEDDLEQLWRMYEESPGYKVLHDTQVGKT